MKLTFRSREAVDTFRLNFNNNHFCAFNFIPTVYAEDSLDKQFSFNLYREN